MTFEEYFGDWSKVIDEQETLKIMYWLKDVNPEILCPAKQNIFRAFKLCPLKDCKVIMLGQDPYPQKGVATGILFGNSADTPEERLSPSLQVVKESVINYEMPHNRIEFDNTMESWAKQGVLMINTALTCEVNRVGSHFNIWQPFMSKLIRNLSTYDGGLIYVLFGNQASLFKKDIVQSFGIFEIYHPAFYARRCEKMPYDFFPRINEALQKHYNTKIKFYNETEYGTC